ncbi:MAG TPA: septal ring lytic transglycosylase RlpA family protein [Gallionella sp.]|nr:septal ring lytic transglycosylase RlpA family protein [Gallionella sp.]
MVKQITILTLATLVLAACGSTPQRNAETRNTPAPIDSRPVGPVGGGSGAGGYLAGDGPGANAPANLDAIPDAVPKSEPLHRYANRPYVALGKTYTPQTIAGNYKDRGIASWYGKKFHGQRTSSGETYDMYGMTAAHPTLPIPSYARVTNVTSGKSVVVRVNDRGPFLHDRVMDLSYSAAYKLGIIGNGSAEVEVESLAPNAIVSNVARAEPVQTRPLEKSKPAKAPTLAAASIGGNVYLQLGAFKSREAAESFMAKMRAELGDVGKQLSVYMQGGLTRVHVGPYANQNEARSRAEGFQDRLGFKPMVNLH